MAKISIIIPCYYNEQNIPITFATLLANEANFLPGTFFEYIFIDDGSGDGTLDMLIKVWKEHKSKVKVIKLAGNVGSYNAIIAGMERATGDCTVIIAADLQDPPELMPEMMSYWTKGIKLVIGSRQDRKDPFWSKIFAITFHKLIKNFALPNVPDGGFDYVLFDRQIRDQLLLMKEQNSNIFYMMIWMGYAYINIPYVRKKREIGISRWTLSKKIKLFIDSFVAFSFFPVRLLTISGILMGILTLLYAAILVFLRINHQIEIEGWTALMVVVLITSSFQMTGLGILGEYIWRNVDAARKRPLYIVEQVYE